MRGFSSQHQRWADRQHKATAQTSRSEIPGGRLPRGVCTSFDGRSGLQRGDSRRIRHESLLIPIQILLGFLCAEGRGEGDEVGEIYTSTLVKIGASGGLGIQSMGKQRQKDRDEEDQIALFSHIIIIGEYV